MMNDMPKGLYAVSAGFAGQTGEVAFTFQGAGFTGQMGETPFIPSAGRCRRRCPAA